MNTDIRLSVNFFNHIKTLKLERRCGKEGVLCLLKLWVWAAVNRPSGELSGYSSEDLELFSGWTGAPGLFCEALRDIGWLDDEGGNSPRLHGWGEFQTWVTGVASREDAGRLSFLARKNHAAYQRLKAEGVSGINRELYAALIKPGWEDALSKALKGASKVLTQAPSKVLTQAPSSPVPAPTPSPSPSPSPSPTPKRTYRGAEKPKDQKPRTDFERKWGGEHIERVNAMDYLRKIQEVVANAPKIPERIPGKPREEKKDDGQ